MVLIADSGSTKCDWVLKKDGEVILEFQTIGYNPIFHREERILNALNQTGELKPFFFEVATIFYFGAGVSMPETKGALKSSLKKVFPNVLRIEAKSDIQGAALAAGGGEGGIACILGTGANACFFNGNDIIPGKPALGYILGDEGSGAYFGKKLLADYLYGLLPESIQNDFKDQFNLDKAAILKHVYQSDRPNVFLASFMPFLSKHKDAPYIQNLLSRSFRKFLLIQVSCFHNYRAYPVHFIGSVGWHFQEEIKKEADRLGITTGQFIQKPINRLKLLNLQEIIFQ